MSPEMIIGNYNEKTDIWSTGMIMYELVEGIVPF